MKKLIPLIIIIFSLKAFSSPVGGVQKVTWPAYRMPATEKSFHDAAENEKLNWGDSLKTGPHGFISLIFFEDGSLVKLAANSSVQLISPKGADKRTINMKFGDLWAKINRTDLGLVVKTPSTTASIKGTQFWLLVSPNGDTRLICQEGILDILNNISGALVSVSAGQMCCSGMDGGIETSQIQPEGAPQPPEPQGTQPEPGTEGMAPQGGPGAPPTPASQPSGGGGGGLIPGVTMNGAVGVATINGVNYQYFGLRPDIPIWKFGVGLDLSFYFDSDGKLREEDWDEAGDYIEKVYYVRFGKPDDKFYLRAGSLSPITLGYGLIMRRYSNAIEWPQVKRIGLQTSIKAGNLTFQGLINNFREIETPGLIGARLTYEKKLILPLVFGGTIVYDGNQYLGAKDADEDGVPDNWDMFPGINDQDHIDWLTGLFQSTPGLLDSLIASGDLPDILHPTPNIEDSVAEVTEWGVDFGIPIIRTKALSLWTYAQMAQITDYGRGYTFPGLMFNLGPFRASAEYRIFEKQFTGEFFDMSYETERVVWSEEDSTYVTKKMTLEGLPSAQGYYAEAGMNFLNLLDFTIAYQNMSYDGGESVASIYGSANLNTKFIPKISLAEAYFQQPNAEKAFSTEADGTVLGYKVGVAVGSGVSVIYDNKTIYYNGEPNHIMTIETALTF